MTAWSKTVPGQNPQLSAPTIVLHRGQSFSKLFALGRLTKIGDFLSSSGNRISYLSNDSLNRRPMVDWTVCYRICPSEGEAKSRWGIAKLRVLASRGCRREALSRLALARAHQCTPMSGLTSTSLRYHRQQTRLSREQPV
jgi:hypothetical protein